MLTAENWARQIFIGLSSELYKQWGFTNNTGRPYITFPFKFSNVFTAISCICHNGSPSEANTVYNVSISGMNIGASGGGSGKYWCAFGVAQQQWGNLWAGYTEVLNWYFPLTTSQVYAVCLTKHTKNISSGHNWEPARIEEWNNSYARIHPDGEITLVYGQYRSQNLLLAALP